MPQIMTKIPQGNHEINIYCMNKKLPRQTFILRNKFILGNKSDNL